MLQVMKRTPLFIDLETTGLDPMQHTILSIGAVSFVKVKKQLQMVEFYGLIRPSEDEWAAASPDALRVNGLTWEYLQEHGRPLADVRDDFLLWIVGNKLNKDRAVFVGQNPCFDMGFLQRFMGDEMLFIEGPSLNNPVDVRDLYSILENRQQVPVIEGRLSGYKISRALGVPEEPEPHHALEGARAVMRNFEKLVEMGALN